MINVFVGSMKAESVAASRIEQTLSEVASSYNSNFQHRPGSHQTWLLQAQIWLHLGRYQSLTATPHPPKKPGCYWHKYDFILGRYKSLSCPPCCTCLNMASFR